MPMIDVSAYKTELLRDIYNSPKIVEAIDSQQIGALSEEPDTLMYKNLFPYMRVPETQNKADTYVLLSVDMDRISRNNRTYALYRVTIWVLAHEDRMAMPAEYQATRIDYISMELDNLFDGQRKFGFSEFELIANREILLDTKYHYREMVFVCRDLRHPVTPL